MRYLITGVSGFVGQYMVNEILKNDSSSEIIGIDQINNCVECQLQFYNVNLVDKEATGECLSNIKPDYLIHLAGITSVRKSLECPYDSFQANTTMTLNLLESIALYSRDTIVLLVGSSEEYGAINSENVNEEQPLKPINPYGISKMLQESLGMFYARHYGLKIIYTRSFNHIGVGQSDVFVVSGIAKRIAQAQLTNKRTIEVGNINIVRDFLDVSDVVRAYYMLLHSGKYNMTFNVCSGKGISINEIIQYFIQLSGANIKPITNPELLRHNENLVIIGSNTRISEEIGWYPTIPITDTFTSIYNYWLRNIKDGN